MLRLFWSTLSRLSDPLYSSPVSHPHESTTSHPVVDEQSAVIDEVYFEAGERKRPRDDCNNFNFDEARKRPRVEKQNSGDVLLADVEQFGTSAGPSPNIQLPFSSPDMQVIERTSGAPAAQSQFLPAAHDFLIQNSVFVSNHSEVETNELTFLFEGGVADASLHSSARYPPPRCHPETRQKLKDSLFSWLRGPQRLSNLFWLYGLAGVGKSAVAQTITESSSEIGFITSTFFFSPNWDNPNRVVPSLAHQLTAAFPVYRNAVIQSIRRDRSIITSALYIQFQRLIVEPLLLPHTNKPPQNPILFVLDGLDECQRDDARREFICLIGSFAATCHRSGLPFLWLIASRPELHIDSRFSAIPCIKQELKIDTPDAQEDVSIFLRDGFRDIRLQYNHTFEPGLAWPSEEEISSILFYASGLPIFAATVLKFVGDQKVGDPTGQLDYCLAFLKGNVALDRGSPLPELDSLYRSILRTIPDSSLPLTMHILGLHIRNKSLSLVSMCKLFSLREVTFNTYMCRLCSILDISAPNEIRHSALRIYHTSFEDFLRRSFTSGEFGVNEVDIITKSRTICMQWYTGWKARTASADFEGRQAAFLSPDNVSGFEYAKEELWRIWTNTPTQEMGQVYTEIREFDFRDVEQRNLRACLILLYRLSLWYEAKGRTLGYNVLRSEPECTTDRDLLEAYSILLKCNRLKKGKRRNIESLDSWSFQILKRGGLEPNHTAFEQMQIALSDPCSTYFLIGYGSNTCIGLVYRDKVKLENYFSEAFEEIRRTYSIVSTDDRVIWPMQSDLRQIVSTAGTSEMNFRTLPCLGRTIVSFVRDPLHGNPVGRLNWMLDVVRQPTMQSLDPRKKSQHIVTLLTQRLLSQIPPTIRPAAEQIIAFIIAPATGTSIDLRSRPFSVEDISRVMETDKKIVLEAARRLNPLLSQYPVPFTVESGLDFRDLLWLTTPPNDESGWCMSRRLLDLIDPLVWANLAMKYVNEFNHALERGSRPDGELESPTHFMPNHSNTSQRVLSKHQLSSLAQHGIWVVLDQVTEASARTVMEAVRNLRFSQLDIRNIPSSRNTHFDVGQFLQFINHFYVLQLKLGLEEIIRLDRNCDTDDKLLERWSKTGISYRKAKFPVATANLSHRYSQLGKSIRLISLHYDTKWDVMDTSEKWNIFLLGHGKNSCLIALCDAYT